MIESDRAPGRAIAMDRSTVSYEDWPSIFAGSVIAAAFLCYERVRLRYRIVASAPRCRGIPRKPTPSRWASGLWVTISSFIAGGYLTGRLRRGLGDGTGHETMCATAFTASSSGARRFDRCYLATMTIAGVAKTGAEVVSNATSAVATAAGDKLAYLTDDILRSDTPVAGQSAANVEATRDEITRLITRSVANGELAPNDRNICRGSSPTAPVFRKPRRRNASMRLPRVSGNWLPKLKKLP